MNPKFVPGYSENYNLTIQRELPAHMVFSVGYVGAEGRHEQITMNRIPSPWRERLCARRIQIASQRRSSTSAFPDSLHFPGQ